MVIVVQRSLMEKRILTALLQCMEAGSGSGIILLQSTQDLDVDACNDAQRAEESKAALASVAKLAIGGCLSPHSTTKRSWPPGPRPRIPLKISPNRARR